MVRVRFAPSPTGSLHLGNIRTALLNYLFAKQKGGKFILRVEDTDSDRNIEQGELKIVEDLNWLGLDYDEGPDKGGKYGPYMQSERTNIYQEKLSELIDACKVYRCFCSAEELEVRRNRQLALGQPPRYDRACLGMSDDMIKQELVDKRPFVWRLQINEDAVVEIETLARGKMRFELKNFGDFALTRSDGSYTFMFANFVDDWLMEITHVIRGEDHLSNSAMQGALFDAFAVKLPVFWHLPMLCSPDGKKMSKRDFGFALSDLKKAGYLPQAICNYLAIQGTTFEEEVQSLEELSQNYNFDKMHSTGAIKYDIDKLQWLNHKWIERLDTKELLKYSKNFLPQDEKLEYLVSKVKTDVKTLAELKDALGFYFQEPEITVAALKHELGLEVSEKAQRVIFDNLEHIENPDYFLDQIKSAGKDAGLKIRAVFGTLRYMLTGSFNGISMLDTLNILGAEEAKKRIKKLM